MGYFSELDTELREQSAGQGEQGDRPEDFEQQEPPAPRSPAQAQQSAAQRIPAVRPPSFRDVTRELRTVLAGRADVTFVTNPRRLERSIPSEGR